MSDKKSRTLYIKRFMEEYADELHPVTISDILAHLSNKGLDVSRQSVVRDIERLTAEGADIICNTGKPNQYFVGDRHFELPEIKMLIDAVRAFRFIPLKKSDALIKKLSGFASVRQAGELRRSLYINQQSRPANDKTYITVDLLYKAENEGKKIICKYFDWNANKHKVFKHEHSYNFSPFGMLINNDRLPKLFCVLYIRCYLSKRTIFSRKIIETP